MSSIVLQVIVSGLLLGAVYALFSSGLTLIWGMMNVINFAHGDFVMLAMYTAFLVWTMFGGGPAASVPIAALVLATIGVLSYFLLLRYSAFWYFGANFKTLPDTILGPPFVLGSIRVDAPRLLAGTIGLLVTGLLHLILTRTALGSRMLAVSEDATAAQLMGIRPEHMQAMAWALAAGATGIAGALIATFFYTSPTVGETLAIVAFVTVAFGGFGSVPGALLAGLLIGVIEAVSAFMIGPVYKDVIVYTLFVLVLWTRPQGLMGKA